MKYSAAMLKYKHKHSGSPTAKTYKTARSSKRNLLLYENLVIFVTKIEIICLYLCNMYLDDGIGTYVHIICAILNMFYYRQLILHTALYPNRKISYILVVL